MSHSACLPITASGFCTSTRNGVADGGTVTKTIMNECSFGRPAASPRQVSECFIVGLARATRELAHHRTHRAVARIHRIGNQPGRHGEHLPLVEAFASLARERHTVHLRSILTIELGLLHGERGAR